MNNYNVPRILKILSDHNINKLIVYNVDNWGSAGLYLFFQKPDLATALTPWSNPIRKV